MMSQDQPVREGVTPPWWQRRTTYTTAAQLITAAVTLIAAVWFTGTVEQKAMIAAVGTALVSFISALGDIFARAGGVEAAMNVKAQTEAKVDALSLKP
jgi:hypothetical protein